MITILFFSSKNNFPTALILFFSSENNFPKAPILFFSYKNNIFFASNFIYSTLFLFPQYRLLPLHYHK